LGGPPQLASLSYPVRKPVGVVGIVTPWNLPLYLLTWKLAPALAMGNALVVKPSELTPTTASMLMRLLHEQGLPEGVANVVHGDGEAGAAVVSHPDVAAVSFTGGTATGKRVAEAAAPQFKKLSLELGGKNATIVFKDCDFEATVQATVRAAFLNSGQICLCGSRLLVDRSDPAFYERFVAAFTAAASELVVGDPFDERTDLGPVISEAHRDKIAGIVERGRAEGRLLCGGPVDGEGYFYRPTVLAGLDHASSVAQQEIFGPVVTVHGFETEQEAIKMANGTEYGLAASVWSESLTALRVAEQLDAGTVWVNTWLARELHMPFGGTKRSGVSREGGQHSLDFYSETSTVCVHRGPDRSPLPMPGR